MNNFEAKLLLIEQGMGWGTLPLKLVETHLTNKQLSVIKLSDFQTTKNVDYHLLKLNKNRLGPVAEKLWHML